MDLQEKLNQGIAAAEVGRKAEARALLTEVVQADENQLEAWLWLSQVVDSLEEQTVCLENVLILDPNNKFAQQQLAQVRERQEKLFAPVYAPGEEEPPPQVVPPPEPPLEIKAEYPHKEDEFDNPWLCPYCTAPTRSEDQSCPTCHKPLIVSRRIKEERTVWLWRGIFLQFVIAFILVVLGIGYFAAITKLSDIPSPFPFLPLYFGQPVDQPEEFVQIVLTVFPKWAFWGLLGVALYSLVLMLILYFRVPNGHLIYLINAGMMLVLGLFGVILFYNSVAIIVACVIVLLLAAAQLLITLNLWDDFTFEQGRLRLKIDRDAKGHAALFLSGRKYSELGMWGLAVIHLRRAVVKEANLTYFIALAIAYMNIRRYELAQETLAKAEKIAPNSLEVWRLKKRLAPRLPSSR
jgi:tetratricopeptide (TPR) repeat protein